MSAQRVLVHRLKLQANISSLPAYRRGSMNKGTSQSEREPSLYQVCCRQNCKWPLVLPIDSTILLPNRFATGWALSAAELLKLQTAAASDSPVQVQLEADAVCQTLLQRFQQVQKSTNTGCRRPLDSRLQQTGCKNRRARHRQQAVN